MVVQALAGSRAQLDGAASRTNPDRVLSATEQVVSRGDHAIPDRRQRWFNLARVVIAQHVPHARIADLGPDLGAQAGA